MTAAGTAFSAAFKLGVLVAMLLLAGCHKDSAGTAAVARSRLGGGNLALLHRAMAKARRGEPVTVCYLGGSITRGEGASDPAKCYAALATDWWRTKFGTNGVRYQNAGVSATGSNYGCLRVAGDVIDRHADVVVVEFGVNDPAGLEAAETYEGVVRQLVADPDAPAVVLLFMMHHLGDNAQDFQSQVGRRYGLPMVSFRDAWWPEIAAGRSKWTDFYADTIHPNDRGHREVARCLTSLFDDALASLPATAGVNAAALPAPVFTDAYARVKYLSGVVLTPIRNDGWTAGTGGVSLESSTPGAAVSFDVGGGVVEMVYRHAHEPMGVARVTVDDGPAVDVDGWFEPTWGAVPQTVRLATGLSRGSHRVRVEVTGQRNPASTGDKFQIVGVAGCDR